MNESMNESMNAAIGRPMLSRPVVRRERVLRWRPHWPDLAVVIASWLLVVLALRVATFVFTAEQGVLYFLAYAVVGATLVGLVLPLGWMVLVRRRPLAELGLTTKRWRLALPLQLVLATLLYLTAFRDVAIPAPGDLIPLIALTLAIGFFEAVFWRGWVQLRLEASFGLVPAILVGSLLYAAYHVGYGMDLSEMIFLFFVGILFAVVFRLVGTVLVLWPLFQPVGQLATLIRDGLELPLIAALGFGEVLLVMLALVWLAHRYERRHRVTASIPAGSTSAR
jgi:membrane protease YdiL (CAAX protease family)